MAGCSMTMVSRPKFRSEVLWCDMSLLLFMVRLPEGTAQRIGALTSLLKRDYGLMNKPIEAQRLHVTLLDLGHHVDLPRRLLERAEQAAASVAMSSFEVVFDRVTAWPASQSLVLLADDDSVVRLAMLRHALEQALERVGLKHRAKTRFTPHATLMRGRTTVEEQTVETFRWTVRDFALVNSLTGHSKYVQLGQWPLRE